MPAETSLRLFVAVELPEDARSALGHACAALVAAVPANTLRPVRPDGIHITLKFLGPVAEERVPAVRDAIGGAVAGAAPFALRTGAPGSFGGPRNLRVAWVGVEGDVAALGALAVKVEAALQPLGFAAETRPFAAHLTLARVRDEASPADRHAVHRAIAELAIPASEIPVREIAIMRSTLQRGGAVYDAIARFPFGG